MQVSCARLVCVNASAHSFHFAQQVGTHVELFSSALCGWSLFTAADLGGFSSHFLLIATSTAAPPLYRLFARTLGYKLRTSSYGERPNSCHTAASSGAVGHFCLVDHVLRVRMYALKMQEVLVGYGSCPPVVWNHHLLHAFLPVWSR